MSGLIQQIREIRLEIMSRPNLTASDRKELQMTLSLLRDRFEYLKRQKPL